MVAYNFQAEFASPIQSLQKEQTIRAKRRRSDGHATPGATLQLYTGMRTRHCQLIGTATCKAVAEILISFGPEPSVRLGSESAHIWITGRRDLAAFARRDGFADWQSLVEFFRAEHGEGNFEGVIIFWERFRFPPRAERRTP